MLMPATGTLTHTGVAITFELIVRAYNLLRLSGRALGYRNCLKCKHMQMPVEGCVAIPITKLPGPTS